MVPSRPCFFLQRWQRKPSSFSPFSPELGSGWRRTSFFSVQTEHQKPRNADPQAKRLEKERKPRNTDPQAKRLEKKRKVEESAAPKSEEAAARAESEEKVFDKI